MKLGIWLPIFGGWLRNREDESMPASFDYCKRVAQLADRLGFHTILVPELNLNDIKGIQEPSLEAWTSAAALAGLTERIRIMAALRPGYRFPALAAKMAANIDEISGGRFEINLVSAWWRSEMQMYTGQWLDHESRYRRSSEFIQVMKGMWEEESFSFAGEFYSTSDAVLAPKPKMKIPIYAGGESDQGRQMIASQCDAYLMHGDSPQVIAENIAQMKRLRSQYDKPELSYGMAAYMICKESEQEAQKELESITNISSSSKALASYEDFIQQSKLKNPPSIQDYSVSNRGLRPGLVGTPEQIIEKLKTYEKLGVELVLLQCSPMLEELEQIGENILPYL